VAKIYVNIGSLELYYWIALIPFKVRVRKCAITSMYCTGVSYAVLLTTVGSCSLEVVRNHFN
jgi:hypothetical protein